MASPPGPEWQRLADLLIARRVELNDAWRNRQQFCRDTGAEYRIVHDVENAKRANYSGSTLALIERAYRWQPGSIRAVLEGGDPTPVNPTARIAGVWASTAPVANVPVDEELRPWLDDAHRHDVDPMDWDLADPLEREIFVHGSFNWNEKSGMKLALRAYKAQARERKRREQENGAPSS